MKSILPERITIQMLDAFESTKNTLEVYNRYVESPDLERLIEKMDNSSNLYELWEQCLQRALQESQDMTDD